MFPKDMKMTSVDMLGCMYWPLIGLGGRREKCFRDLQEVLCFPRRSSLFFSRAKRFVLFPVVYLGFIDDGVGC